MLDCTSFKPFQVLQFPWEFDGDPQSVLKLWIVARNLPDAELILCFKPTSVTTRWDKEAILLDGAVEYQAGELEVFNNRTIIDPVLYNVSYSHLRSCYVSAKVEVVGELPADFRGRIKNAVTNHPGWNNQKMKAVLERLG